MPTPKGTSGGGTLDPGSWTLYSIDLGAEGAADLTGESSVTLGGLSFTLTKASSMTTMELDGTDGLDLVQAPNSDNTNATTDGEIKIRIRRSDLSSTDSDLAGAVIGFRVTSTPGAGYISAAVQDAALSSTPEIVRMQIGSLGANEYRCQDISGGSATDGGKGSAIPLQAALVIYGAYSAAYYSEDADELTAADLDDMIKGVAPTARATWVLCQEGAFSADVIDADAWLVLGIGNGLTATTVETLSVGVFEASIG